MFPPSNILLRFFMRRISFFNSLFLFRISAKAPVPRRGMALGNAARGEFKASLSTSIER